MLNKTFQVGRLTKQPHIIKHEGRESATAYFVVAVKDNFKSKNEYATQFISAQSYLKNQNSIDYYSKLGTGDLVELTGMLRFSTWTDNQNVQKHSLQVHAESIRVLKRAKQNTTSNFNDSYSSSNTTNFNNQDNRFDYPKLADIPLDEDPFANYGATPDNPFGDSPF